VHSVVGGLTVFSVLLATAAGRSPHCLYYCAVICVALDAYLRKFCTGMYAGISLSRKLQDSHTDLVELWLVSRH